MSFTLIIQLIGLVAVLGIVWWVLQSIPLPQPARILIVVLFAILAIGVIGNITGLWSAPMWRGR